MDLSDFLLAGLWVARKAVQIEAVQIEKPDLERRRARDRPETVLLCGAAILVACSCSSSTRLDGPAASRDAGACALSPAAQELLGQVLNSIEQEADSAAADNFPTELEVLWFSVGTDVSSGFFAHLAVSCTEPSVQDATCLSDFGGSLLADVDACFRTGCEAADVLDLDIYTTLPPHRLPEDRVSISYPTAPPFPAGTVTYDPNPVTRWRLDFGQPDVTSMSATLEQQVSVALATGEKIDLSFEGQTSGQGTTDGTFTTMTALSLGRLSSTGPVEVTMTNSDSAPWSGDVMLGHRTLASITQDGLVWKGDCAASMAVGRDGGSR